MGIKKIEAGPSNGRIEFESDTQVDPLSIVKMVQSEPQNYSLDGADALKFKADMDEHEKRLNTIKELLKKLSPETDKSGNRFKSNKKAAKH